MLSINYPCLLTSQKTNTQNLGEGEDFLILNYAMLAELIHIHVARYHTHFNDLLPIERLKYSSYDRSGQQHVST
jgi:hypothetical protein